jgi:hypothetical protein
VDITATRDFLFIKASGKISRGFFIYLINREGKKFRRYARARRASRFCPNAGGDRNANKTLLDSRLRGNDRLGMKKLFYPSNKSGGCYEIKTNFSTDRKLA